MKIDSIEYQDLNWMKMIGNMLENSLSIGYLFAAQYFELLSAGIPRYYSKCCFCQNHQNESHCFPEKYWDLPSKLGGKT
jgi:hypothetical protein